MFHGSPLILQSGVSRIPLTAVTANPIRRTVQAISKNESEPGESVFIVNEIVRKSDCGVCSSASPLLGGFAGTCTRQPRQFDGEPFHGKTDYVGK